MAFYVSEMPVFCTLDMKLPCTQLLVCTVFTCVAEVKMLMVVLKLILMNMISNGAGVVLKNENQSCDTLLVGAFFGGKFFGKYLLIELV